MGPAEKRRRLDFAGLLHEGIRTMPTEVTKGFRGHYFLPEYPLKTALKSPYVEEVSV